MSTRPPPGQTENLAELDNLTEQSLLQELKVRFGKNIIYTYVGEILVTVNPYKWIDGIYENSVANKYKNIGDKASLPPHLFAVADLAFTNLNSGKSQVCVISGESGAGKTEAAKLFVKQLLHCCPGSTVDGLHDKLVQVNPLLEAFGNAQTLMNDNSSRFGKFTDVVFSAEGLVKGAVMRQYLLEKSRVVNQADGEQNFHVFYLLFAGLDAEMKSKLELGSPEDHRFINSNDTALRNIKSKKIQDMRKELMDCISIVGFTKEEQDDMWAILSGILHFGDLEFQNEDAAEITSTKDKISKACNQLGIDETSLELALTRQVNIIRGEETERAYKLHEAEGCRDATAKALYERLFSWIVTRCNELLGPKDAGRDRNDMSIGILDIFGFECFDVNSFEQLCINLANEQLQYFFNEHIFRMELDEYKKEGLDDINVSYEDNKPLLDLILESKPLGLLGIVDEESNFPKATDQTMVEKFHAAFSKHKYYERPRSNDPKFSLKHYAGTVQYDGYGFLEKNRDNLAVDVIGALRVSENELVKNLFLGDEAPKEAKRKAPAARGKLDRSGSKARMRQSIKHAAESLAKKKKLTVGSNFKVSLVDLMFKLNSANPHFVRCIKPNPRKQPDLFEDELVTKQLRYTGMLETTRIRREGFPSRPLFADFVRQYDILAWGIPNVQPNVGTCRLILERAGINGFQVGKTKIFLRYYHVDQLNEKLKPILGACRDLQKFARGFVARRRVSKLLAAKRDFEKRVESFMSIAERNLQGSRDVMLSLCDEDAKRPLDFWTPKAAPEPPKPKKKESGGTIGKSGIGRAASVRWFKEVEKKKGAGQSNGDFSSWFHGVITRQQSEALLDGKKSGTYLVRVAESRFGYSLSLIFNGRHKHFMIDVDESGKYQVIGNDRKFDALNDLVRFHEKHPVTNEGDALLHPCPTQGQRTDLDELEE